MNDAPDTRKDTIAARATAPGVAAIAIVRLSGPDARAVAEKIAGPGLEPRQALVRSFTDGQGALIDQGLVLYFAGPASFTGEDVVEFQCHGAEPVVDWLLETVYQHGVRAAQAGEFSLRAFLNNRLDLTRAEAIADLIGSGSRSAAKAAVRSLSGEFADQVGSLQAQLTALRVRCEAWLDFPEEDLDPAVATGLRQQTDTIGDELTGLLATAHRGVQLADGVRVVIAGPANAGKSSLLNRLAAESAAIVSDQAGTTRDALERRLIIAGVPVEVVDTAGLRESSDAIEREGMQRARAAIESADLVLWLADVTADPNGEAAEQAARVAIGAGTPYAVLLNKIDLLDDNQGSSPVSAVRPQTSLQEPAADAKVHATDTRAHAGASARPDYQGLYPISVQRGDGLPAVEDLISGRAGEGGESGGTFSARRRHLAALEYACAHVKAAAPLIESAMDLAAEELRLAQHALSELTGEITSDELLGEIFSTFCIGK